MTSYESSKVDKEEEDWWENSEKVEEDFFSEKNNWFKKVCFYADVDYRDILVVAYTNM